MQLSPRSAMLTCDAAHMRSLRRERSGCQPRTDAHAGGQVRHVQRVDVRQQPQPRVLLRFWMRFLIGDEDAQHADVIGMRGSLDSVAATFVLLPS